MVLSGHHQHIYTPILRLTLDHRPRFCISRLFTEYHPLSPCGLSLPDPVGTCKERGNRKFFISPTSFYF